MDSSQHSEATSALTDRNYFMSHFNKQKSVRRTRTEAIESETKVGTIAQAAESGVNPYGPSFQSRQPRLSKLAAYRSGITTNGHFPGNDFDEATLNSARSWCSCSSSCAPSRAAWVRDPARSSSAFNSSGRAPLEASNGFLAKQAYGKVELRTKVLQGIPPRSSLPHSHASGGSCGGRAGVGSSSSSSRRLPPPPGPSPRRPPTQVPPLLLPTCRE